MFKLFSMSPVGLGISDDDDDDDDEEDWGLKSTSQPCDF
jgi:hypothetical protein